MNLIFMGSPEFAIPSLNALLLSSHNIIGVFTQPDRPRARGRKYLSTPVKILAEKKGISVYTPGSLRKRGVLEVIENKKPDAIIVVAYGLLIPKDILGIPSKGCINVHASLLPKYRGAAPIERAIMNGESLTGITTMYMAEGLDTGDIILQKELEISGDITCGELSCKLACLGSELLMETLGLIEQGIAPRIPQNENLATYAPKLTQDEFIIDWHKPVGVIHNLVRAGNPCPGAFTYLQGKRFKVFTGNPVRNKDILPYNSQASPGQICYSDRENLIIKTGKGFYSIKEVQCEGSRRLQVGDYLCGNPIQVGDVLGK